MLTAKVSIVLYMNYKELETTKKEVDERSLYFYVAVWKCWVSAAIFSPMESEIESAWHNEKASGRAWSRGKAASQKLNF